MNINENGIYYYNCDDIVLKVKVKKVHKNGDLLCESISIGGEILIIEEFRKHLFVDKKDAFLDLKKSLEEFKQEIEKRLASTELIIQGCEQGGN